MFAVQSYAPPNAMPGLDRFAPVRDAFGPNAVTPDGQPQLNPRDLQQIMEMLQVLGFLPPGQNQGWNPQANAALQKFGASQGMPGQAGLDMETLLSLILAVAGALAQKQQGNPFGGGGQNMAAPMMGGGAPAGAMSVRGLPAMTAGKIGGGPGTQLVSANPGAGHNAAAGATAVAPQGSTQFNGYNWPTQGRISSRFGPRWGRHHGGLDIAAPTGTKVGASAPGVVTSAGRSGGYGNMVEIKHADGSRTRYAHLSQINVRPGQQVGANQRIGAVGSTGNSTGPHLHFEIRKPGQGAVDPLRYLG